MSFPVISDFIPQHYSNIKAITEIVEETTSEIAIGIFSAAFSYSIETLPSLVFYAIHIVQPSLISYITHGNLLINSIMPLIGGGLFIGSSNYLGFFDNTETALQLIQWLGTVALVTELAAGILFPPSLAVHLTVRGIIFVSSIVGNLSTIHKGCQKIHTALTDQNLKTSEKVSKTVLGLISVGFGITGSITTIKTASKLYEGLKIYQTFDQTQKFYALKYYGLESLSEVKPQKAIIINGLSGEWAHPKNYNFDNTPDPVAYTIYQNYETRVYEVKSSAELAKVMNLATQELGGKLDMICLMGHASKNSITLNQNYKFRANFIESNAIGRNISKNGEVLLWGCETAQSRNSLTEKTSKLLPKIQITGFSESITPLDFWTFFENGKLRIKAWHWDNYSIVRMFKNGIAVA